MLLIDDPSSPDDLGNKFDLFFLIFYAIEMGLKIIGLGFIWNKKSYLRSGWNWLDMTIVVTGFLPHVISSDNNLKISVLRSFRVLRPLKTITSLKNLMMIVMTLISAFPYILNTLLILFFFLLIYSIIATQLLEGNLKKRCFSILTGVMTPQTRFFDRSYLGVLCGYDDCPNPEINVCGKLLDNPNSNTTNFDNFIWALLMMIQEITLENWSYNMYYVARTTDYYGALIIFISLAFIGAFIFLNLMASVITNSYHEQVGIKTSKIKEKNKLLFDRDVQEFLQHKSQERNKMKSKELKRNFADFRLKENSQKKISQELEVEFNKDSKNIEKHTLPREIQHILSIEELAPLFQHRKSVDQYNSIKNLQFNGGNSSEDEDLIKQKNQINGGNSHEETPVQKQKSIFSKGDTNSANKAQVILKDAKTQVDLNEKYCENQKSNWFSRIKIKKIFLKTIENNFKEKFKNFKLKVNHSIEYESNSLQDVIEQSFFSKKKIKDLIIENKLKQCKSEVIYKMRENFEINKKEIQEKFNDELIGKYLELNEKNGRKLIKQVFFNFIPNQTRLPLTICSNSLVFQTKMENLLDKNFKKKKNAFHYFLGRGGNSSRTKKKRLKSLKFSMEDIKYSMGEVLSKKEDLDVLKEFSNENDYKIIRKFDYQTRKLNERVPGVDVDLNWSGKEVLDYRIIREMKVIVKSIKQENKILMALSTKNQNKIIWMNGFFGKVFIFKNIKCIFCCCCCEKFSIFIFFNIF